MQWKEAFRKAQFCKEAVAAPLKVTSDIKLPSNRESTIMCKIKVRKGEIPDNCYIIDGSYCPLTQ